jgi:hypothetical protein
MSSVSETMVREYFELHGFLVRQQRKFVGPNKLEDDQIDFFVLNPVPRALQESAPLPFILGSENLKSIQRAVVVVKGWHTETFSTAVLENAPEIFRFVEQSSFQQASRTFGQDGIVLKILIVPALPQNPEACEQSITLLRSKGIDSVIPFRTVLLDLIQATESNRNYQKSDLLQVIRVLKNYDFFKDPQLELFKNPPKPRKKKTAPPP